MLLQILLYNVIKKKGVEPMKLEDVTPRIMDKYYRDLLSVKAVSSKYVKARTEYLTPHTVREVHKTLRNAFNQAVKWELMTRNPVEHATLPKEEHKTRDIWTAEVLQKALEACDDDILRLANQPCLLLFPANGRASGAYLGLY